jgi:hypothetical protein
MLLDCCRSTKSEKHCHRKCMQVMLASIEEAITLCSTARIGSACSAGICPCIPQA